MNQRTDDEPPQREPTEQEYATILADGFANCQLVASHATAGFDLEQSGYTLIIKALRAFAVPPPAATGETPITDEIVERHNREFVGSGFARGGEARHFDELIGHARQLERERDDARRELAEANLTIRYERDRNLQKVKEARAQPPSAAAPVAWLYDNQITKLTIYEEPADLKEWIPLYAAPQSATRDINAIHKFLGPNSGLTVRDVASVLDAADKVRP